MRTVSSFTGPFPDDAKPGEIFRVKGSLTGLARKEQEVSTVSRCPHGYIEGKCMRCDLTKLRAENERLRAALDQAAEDFRQVKFKASAAKLEAAYGLRDHAIESMRRCWAALGKWDRGPVTDDALNAPAKEPT